MGIENVKVGILPTFAHGTQIKFVDVDGVERSGEYGGSHFGDTPAFYEVNVIENGERVVAKVRADAVVSVLS